MCKNVATTQLNFLSHLTFTSSKSRSERSVWGRMNAPQGTGPTELANRLCWKSSHINIYLTFTVTSTLLPKMAWVYYTDFCLPSSWLVRHSWDRTREPQLCLHERVNFGCCWGGRPGLWLSSPYLLLPPQPRCPSDYTATSSSGCLHHPVIPLTLCPPRCHCLGTGDATSWGTGDVTTWGWEMSPLGDGRCQHLGTGGVNTWGEDEKRQHRTGKQWHFLTIHAGFSRSGRSIAVLFHLLLETNGSRKIDKSEVTQLLLLDIFSSNRLGEEGVTKKVTFWPNRMFPQQIFILVD